jgi:hypothetical protein
MSHCDTEESISHWSTKTYLFSSIFHYYYIYILLFSSILHYTAHLTVMLSFDAIRSQLLTASLNQFQIGQPITL